MRSVQETAYQHVREKIVGGYLPEGGFITEGQVASELNVSRTPVREAFVRLEAEHLLHLVPKKGALVPPISNREIEEVMETRELIETYAVKAVIRDGVDLSEPLKALLDEQAAHLADPRRFIDLDRQFHLHIVESVGNRLLTGLYEGLRDRQLRTGVRAVVSSPDRASRVLDEHHAIVAALVDKDQRGAERSVRRHLRSTLRTLKGSRAGIT
jgi:DNA-binding GntR family transcriptional regulator